MQLAKHLLPPYKFRTNAPSAQLPRHRNTSVSSLNATGADGREHLLLTFYIEGRTGVHTEFPHPDESYWDQTTQWAQDQAARIATTSLDDAIQWSKTTFLGFVGASQRIFAILIGVPLPSSQPPPAQNPPPQQELEQPNAASSWGLGMFSSLRSKRPATPASEREATPEFSFGEVHADFVRVCSFITARPSESDAVYRARTATSNSGICSLTYPVRAPTPALVAATLKQH